MFTIANFKPTRSSYSKDAEIFDDLSQCWVQVDDSRDSSLEDALIDWLALDSMCSRLSEQEEVWRDRQQILVNHGYVLRPRLRPGWMPSWRRAGEQANPFQFEDSKALPKSHSDALFRSIDARRISDGKLVRVKRVQANSIEHEIAVTLLQSGSDSLMPVIDVFQSREKPKEAFVVTPFLRMANSPAFNSVDDILDCGEQLLENLVALHSKGIAHRSIAVRDLAIDAAPLFPQGFHPIQDDCLPDGVTPIQPLKRKHARVNYYITNFRSAVHLPSPYDPEKPAMLDADRDVLRGLPYGTIPPELRAAQKGTRVQYDPCMLDVWLLGSALDRMFNQTGLNLHFLRPFFDRMCHSAPGSRPTAVEALRLWRDMRAERMEPSRSRWSARDQVEWLKEHSFRAHLRSKALELVRQLGDRHRPTPSEMASSEA